ncbi:MAG: protein translocase subunit SecF [Bacillota bacterium]
MSEVNEVKEVKAVKEFKIVENRMKYFAISILIIACGLISMAMNASSGNGMLNFDIEFTGGTSMEIDLGEEYSDDIAVLNIVEEVTGQINVQIQSVSNSNTVIVKMPSIDSVQREALAEGIAAVYPNSEILSSADVSGVVSEQMQTAAIQAIVVACVAMLIYISFRFRDFRAGGSAILALVHDVLIVLTAYSVLRIPVDNAFIAVLLTVLGYSVNATIVIFDRVRENHTSYKKDELAKKMNDSIRQTLGRSIHTSITTFLAVGSIYFLGVQSIKEFALPMMVGIVAGIYSSIFISASIWYTFLTVAKPKDDDKELDGEPELE